MRVIALDQLQQFTAVQLLSDPGAIGGPKIAPNCAQITIVWNLADGKIGASVLGGHYSGAFAGTVAQANSIMTALSTGGAWTALAAFIASTAAINAIRIRDINSANQPILQSTNAIVPGTSASPAVPSEVALVITERTAFVGRANRGRIYVPGWATNALGTSDTVAAAAVTALQNWAQTIPTALSAQGYTLSIVQPARNAYTGSTGTPHPARPAGSTPVTSLVVRDNHWDSQRRRGLK